MLKVGAEKAALKGMGKSLAHSGACFLFRTLTEHKAARPPVGCSGAPFEWTDLS